jgi:hypothetical protein
MPMVSEGRAESGWWFEIRITQEAPDEPPPAALAAPPCVPPLAALPPAPTKAANATVLCPPVSDTARNQAGAADRCRLR